MKRGRKPRPPEDQTVWMWMHYPAALYQSVQTRCSELGIRNHAEFVWKLVVADLSTSLLRPDELSSHAFSYPVSPRVTLFVEPMSMAMRQQLWRRIKELGFNRMWQYTAKLIEAELEYRFLG